MGRTRVSESVGDCSRTDVISGDAIGETAIATTVPVAVCASH
jgi:hypothetical protein